MIDQVLASWVQERLGASLRSHRSVAGGCIHGAWCLELTAGRRVFLKTNRADALPLLAAEADGLRALAPLAPPGLQVPMPLACERVGDQALLLLPWLELGEGPGRSAAASSWQRLGRDLARLHRASLSLGPGQGCYGWGLDNFIGATPQINGWDDDWGVFFADRRLGVQLQFAARSGLHFNGGQLLQELVPEWLASHAAEPVLVHGDLWSGNAGLLGSAGAAVFDPAVYRGDREVDLAMARMFGGFPDAFFAGYQAEWPLPPHAAERVELYNLYHLLNHANVFGGGYCRQAQQSIDSLLGRHGR